MKITKILFLIGIISLLVLAGCNSNVDKSYAPSNSEQKYVGGGCGVGASADNSELAQDVAETKLANEL